MDSESTVKAKKTRRRLRLSCVECTKRRQKCDRANPCGLCTSRGVAHLCRWSSVPFARPTPARPPSHARLTTELEDKIKIQQLSDRICALETQLESGSTNRYCLDSSGQFTSTTGSPLFTLGQSSTSLSSDKDNAPSNFSSPEPTRWISDQEQAHLLASRLNFNSDMLESISPSLGQLVGYQEERLGPGSSLHILQHIIRNHAPEVYARTENSHSCFDIFMKPTFGQNTIQLATLLEKVPLQSDAEQLINSYFHYANWNFGLLESWTRTAVNQMYEFIHYPGSLPGNCLSPNWLCLFFAILASVPLDVTITDNVHDSEEFLMCSIAALRIADDMQDRSSKDLSSLEGTLLTCLAIPMLSKRYAALGRLGEAWKLLGNGVRIAQSLGLNCDSENMSWTTDEKCLRRLAWINLAIWDRLYSLLFNRPSMSFRRFSNIFLESTNLSEGLISAYLSALHDLSLLAEDINELCLMRDSCQASAILRLDYKLHEWEKSNDYGKTFGYEHTGPIKNLSTWYLFLRMKLHTKCIGSDVHGMLTESSSSSPGGGKKTLVDICVDLIETQCAAYDPVAACPTHEASIASFRNTVTFSPSFDPGTENLLMLLEASMTLLLQLDRQHHSTNEVINLLHTVYEIFHGLCSRSPRATAGNISYIGQTIIQAFLQNWHLGVDVKSVNLTSTPSSRSSPSTAIESPPYINLKATGDLAAVFSEIWPSTGDSTPTGAVNVQTFSDSYAAL
ncbi:hypothetical protein GYMLUDRAFT_67663 [Collybiopsis luxurians FD-317 M1]|nr:hypothetical protein GYMLUDRAFT_67663 [Collybiopsis luxurians FD-317 M1]